VTFVDMGAKVDGTYYCDLLLSQLNSCCLSYVMSVASLYFKKVLQHIGHVCYQTLIFHTVV